MDGLDGKVAIVTGAGQGLGKAYSLALARNGVRVVLADINLQSARQVSDEIKKKRNISMEIQMDVSKEESVVAGVQKIADNLGSVDVLINNAALQPPRMSFDQISIEDWDKMMNVNLKSCWLTAKAVYPFMKREKKGKIINITSTLAIKGGAGELHYAVSKGGVIALTRSLAQELGEHNITVNVVAPGLTLTGTTQKNYNQSVFEGAASRRCIKRIEYPEDVVGTILFLASDGSDFITGQTFVVSGGDYFN